HYLDCDYDLSGVMFITTANTLERIPRSLRDRLEVIRIAGFLETEKLQIAKEVLAQEAARAERPQRGEHRVLRPGDSGHHPPLGTRPALSGMGTRSLGNPATAPLPELTLSNRPAGTHSFLPVSIAPLRATRSSLPRTNASVPGAGVFDDPAGVSDDKWKGLS